MKVETLLASDFESFIDLSKEAEDLFGPMANEAPFQTAIKDAITRNAVFCVRDTVTATHNKLKGGIVISEELNAILWLFVSKQYRHQGVGKSLLKAATTRLSQEKEIVVQTFDKSVSAGLAARNFYLNAGFIDVKGGGKNPAGIPTVIMHLAKKIT